LSEPQKYSKKPSDASKKSTSLLFVDVFDTMGTLIGVSSRAGLLDEQGQLPRADRALLADAGASAAGACIGTSTVTCYIESAAGVEAGGRTGLTAIVTACCFLAALFLNPIILAIPAIATAPALIIVGIFMMQSLSDLDLSDIATAGLAQVRREASRVSRFWN